MKCPRSDLHLVPICQEPGRRHLLTVDESAVTAAVYQKGPIGRGYDARMGGGTLCRRAE